MKSDVTRREANKIMLDMFAHGLLIWFALSSNHVMDKPGDNKMHWAISILGMLAMLYFTASTLIQLKKGMPNKELYKNLIGLLFLACVLVYILIPITSQYNLVRFALLINIILLVATFFVLLFHLIKRRKIQKLQ